MAARYARADAAGALLRARANANAQDNSGRTPLHAAVAADALGVFSVSMLSSVSHLYKYYKNRLLLKKKLVTHVGSP